jgi:hypothetical protein
MAGLRWAQVIGGSGKVNAKGQASLDVLPAVTVQTAKMRPGKTQRERGFAFAALISAHREGCRKPHQHLPPAFQRGQKNQHSRTLPIAPDMR